MSASSTGKDGRSRTDKLRVLDLFSGIGGFSLGLERTGGFETVAFCEIEEFPRRVLAKHWPEVPCYHDVRELTADALRSDGIAVDVITGGFPCQDLSIIGKKAGLEGERSGLWSEIVRLIGELRPSLLIVENVANLLDGPSGRRGAWFCRVLGDLAECGYDAEWENIPACVMGAPHRRERVWIVAYPYEVGLQGRVFERARERVEALLENQLRWDIPQPYVIRGNDGISHRAHRIAALGNTVIPQIPELIGHAILEAERAAA